MQVLIGNADRGAVIDSLRPVFGEQQRLSFALMRGVASRCDSLFQGFVNCFPELWGVGGDLGIEACQNLTVLADQELREIPADVA